MESVHPDAAATTTPNHTNLATTCNARRWFEEEAAISNHDIAEEYSEDEDDVYNEILATELLHHSSIPTNSDHPSASNKHSNETLIDTTNEGLGTIFTAYREIIHDCIQSVFRIDTPK